jgi:tRNA threonylcarbamoyladenosine biosynthesis protein TsaB
VILTIRTDKPEAEIGLFENSKRLTYRKWHAHRELSATIHKVIKELLDQQNKDWRDITGIIFYKGPGSFTGLRIGASVANAISTASGTNLVSQNGEKWIELGIERLEEGKNETALPEYGSDPHITKPKK